jgi:hypothetical protein
MKRLLPYIVGVITKSSSGSKIKHLFIVSRNIDCPALIQWRYSVIDSTLNAYMIYHRYIGDFAYSCTSVNDQITNFKHIK